MTQATIRANTVTRYDAVKQERFDVREYELHYDGCHYKTFTSKEKAIQEVKDQIKFERGFPSAKLTSNEIVFVDLDLFETNYEGMTSSIKVRA